MRDSGIPWLGDVAADWTQKRFKFVADIMGGQVDPREQEYAHEVLVAPNHVESGTGTLLARETAANQGARSGKYKVRAGEVIYSKIRPALRKAVIADEDCLCSADMYPIRPRGELLPRFLLELLLSDPVSRYLTECSMRVAMPKVNRETLGDCWLSFPGIEEQAEILTAIAARTEPLDRLRASLRVVSTLVMELSAVMVWQVVAGRFDVRALTKVPADLMQVLTRQSWVEADGLDDEELTGSQDDEGSFAGVAEDAD